MPLLPSPDRCAARPSPAFHRRCTASLHSSAAPQAEAADTCCGSFQSETAPCRAETADMVPSPYRSPVAASPCTRPPNTSTLFPEGYPPVSPPYWPAFLHLAPAPGSELVLLPYIRESHEPSDQPCELAAHATSPPPPKQPHSPEASSSLSSY